MEIMMGTSFAAALAAAALAAGAGPHYHVIDTVPGPDGGWDYVRVDAANNRVLVTRGGSVMSLDLAARAVTLGLSPGQRLHDALPLNGGREILVTHGGSDTAVFADGATGATLATVPTGKNPDAAGLEPRSGLVLVMDHSGGDVVLIDPHTRKDVGRIEVGGDLEAAAFDGAGRAYVNVEDRNQVAVIDIASRTVVARYALTGCDAPTGIAYDAADKLLLIACDGSTEVVEAATGKVLQTLTTGKGADGIAWDEGRKRAFVSAGEGTLSVIEVTAGRAAVVQTVQTRRSARTIALDPRSGRLYLPSAEYGPPPSAGGRPTLIPGSFRLLVVGE
jgi:DNA-binding beta-propeller fold protein YncE